MKIFVAGASGALGSALVPRLVARGHAVTGMVRRPESAARVEAMGALSVIADGLDAPAVAATVERAAPEAIVHQLTALAGAENLLTFGRSFARTNRLRVEGGAALIAGARLAGTRRFVAQSFCGWPYARVGGPVKSEDDPLDPDPPAQFRETLHAIQTLEAMVLGTPGLHGVVLRYGGFYGPGTAFARDGSFLGEVRRRRAPLIGDASGVFSFIHIEDAAEATVAAIEGEATGVFNIVDDDPAPVREWLPWLARIIGAPPPRRAPAWLMRLVLPEHLYLMMTAVRGGSNARIKAAFGWAPKYASWREGFSTLADRPRPGDR